MDRKYDDLMLQQINKNADLLGYVSQQMDLEEKGGDWWGHCPKHIDNTPSFSITPEMNSFYCFSCGRSGGIIGYLMQYEDLPFEEAVQKAAKIASVDLSQMCHSETIAFLRRIKTQTALRRRKKEEHPILSHSEIYKYKKQQIPEWLDEGIEQEVMDLFGVRVDTKQNKIVYPVYDIDGNLINIKARTRLKDYKKLKIPKYINYFKVGTMDYFQGLNITLPYVKEKKEIIIFESVKSVMKAYGWGYKNCASAEKHTLTDEQLDLLIKLRVDVVLAYDSDVNYFSDDVRESIDKLKRLTNVYIIQDRHDLLGGAEAKNAPVDCGLDTWKDLYYSKRKVV